jgi:hypothetical protein
MAKTETGSRQTKIICTLGPACWDIPTLEDLIEEGMSVARFNFSHGDHEGHKACLDRLRQAAANKKKHVGTYLPIEAMRRIESHESGQGETLFLFFFLTHVIYILIFLFYSCLVGHQRT